MSRLLKAAPLVILCVLVIAAPSVWAYWIQDGPALCTASGDQVAPSIVSDGVGGVIVAWHDHRSTTLDIYAQRVSPLGEIEWTINGAALCTATGDQEITAIASDGANGAIVTWTDNRNGNWDIYAQRVNSSGVALWTANGVLVCTATSSQWYSTIASDGLNGAIITWYDNRNGNWDIYAQRLNASGTALWAVNGVVICTASGDQDNPAIVSDGANGAIITWYDKRSGNYDIYAQKVNASGAVQWAANGVALCTASGDQEFPAIVSDGASGAIVTWSDYRGGTGDVYAQRVNASGAVQWTANGVALCTAVGDQWISQIVSDGASGAIVTWQDNRGTNADVYAQRVNAAGAVQWTTDGVALCTATGNQYNPTIASDGSGGAVVSWWDARNGSNWDIYAQKVNASGTVQWTANGVALCMATADQENPEIISDAAGGAIVTWTDLRNGASNADIYAQLVDSKGRVGYTPDILSVRDVPHDQGGRVRITINRSKLDSAQELTIPVLTYNVWQRVDNAALLASVAQASGAGAAIARTSEESQKGQVDAASLSGLPAKELNGRYFVQSKELLKAGAFAPGTWELVGSFAACQQDQYIYRAGTLADSTGDGIPYSVYIVSAHTTTPSVWFASYADSGYSVDNIAPVTPTALAGKQSYTPVGLRITWKPNTESDLAHYAVYRGTSADFVPGAGNLLVSPGDTAAFDGSWRWSSGYYYKVSAMDIHGNESLWALLTPDAVTGTETPKAPAASYLSQNYPNPFNPMTRIAFGLSAPGHVSLRIYDVAGRLVRALVNDDRRAGRYDASWDGRDSGGRAVASGIYFYRLNAGAFESTKKMILVR